MFPCNRICHITNFFIVAVLTNFYRCTHVEMQRELRYLRFTRRDHPVSGRRSRQSWQPKRRDCIVILDPFPLWRFVVHMRYPISLKEDNRNICKKLILAYYINIRHSTSRSRIHQKLQVRVVRMLRLHLPNSIIHNDADILLVLLWWCCNTVILCFDILVGIRSSTSSIGTLA